MNLKKLLIRAVELHGERPALRFKAEGEWAVRTYADFLGRVRRAAEVLHRLGVRPGDRVALMRENAPDWAEAYFGIVGCGGVAVPIDPKLKDQEVSHILTDSGAIGAFAGARQYPLFRDLERRHPELRFILVADGTVPRREPSARVKHMSFVEAVTDAGDPAEGRGAWDHHSPGDDDLASLIYTSGTTGRQKGAMLTHGNFTSNALACTTAIQVKAEDDFLLVLPLFHAFAFTANLLVPVAAGACISFAESIRAVGDNLREVSPTVLMAVPLLLDKLLARMEGGIRENAVARVMTRLGIYAPVRRRVAQRLGGALRLLVSGGAPCDPDTLRGLRRLGVNAIEGYGLTEAAPVVSFNPILASRIGTVGRPIPGIEVRILEPDAAGTGEIAVRGPNVMTGYYRNPEATAEVLRAGWLATGDLGHLDADGYLSISGRKKALIVNREGKNIYPEEVELQLHHSPYILESLVVGYRETDERVGEKVGVMVVPNQEAIDDLGRARGTPLGEAEVEELLRSEVQRLSQGIADYKRPRRVLIRSEEFEKTSTGKIKRYLYATRV